ncbi:hypothetical protein NDU88_005061 [Pleurodeles waltl]|uniref:RanBP2-type domain-containing protein n=1 Tax=Pleurodeles waltl TaxID=8319 RepID=A0AAV7QK40_PLEWA|nr:hypothetical protein NDU88_005061 [Pleurodeles waltl]
MPWRLQPLREAPASSSPSSGLSCQDCSKTNRLECGRCGDPSDRIVMRPGAREFFLWAPKRRETDPLRSARWRLPSCERNRRPHRVH